MTKVTVTGGTITAAEEKAYIDWATEKYGMEPVSLEIHLDGEFADVKAELPDKPFERIRRITGYLVGTLDRFNNGKRSEERDRVKHGI